MHDLALQAAGLLAIVAAAIHGVLGEAHVFRRARIEPASLRLLLRLVWQCGAVAWIGFGILLLAAPSLELPLARHWIVAVAAGVFACGAIGNAWATRGRHFGWIALASVVGLSLAGV